MTNIRAERELGVGGAGPCFRGGLGPTWRTHSPPPQTPTLPAYAGPGKRLFEERRRCILTPHSTEKNNPNSLVPSLLWAGPCAACLLCAADFISQPSWEAGTTGLPTRHPHVSRNQLPGVKGLSQALESVERLGLTPGLSDSTAHLNRRSSQENGGLRVRPALYGASVHFHNHPVRQACNHSHSTDEETGAQGGCHSPVIVQITSLRLQILDT